MTKPLLSLALCLAVFSTACKKSSITKEEIKDEQLGIMHFSKENVQSVAKYLFEDNEPETISYDKEKRSFLTTNPLQISVVNDSLKVKFYSPRSLSNVSVYARLNGYPNPIKVALLDEVPAFGDFSLYFSNLSKEKVYETQKGTKVSVPKINNSTASFFVDSDDPYFKTLKEITVKWNVSFSPYSRTGSWGKKILPVHMKEGVALALNLTYLFSTQEYRDSTIINWKGKFYGNQGVNDIVDNEELMRKITSDRALVMGHTVMVGGLGGGSTYGLAEWQFIKHYADDTSETEVAFHEFGHCLGFSHDSNLTYGIWWRGNAKLYEKMCIEKRLPIYSRNFLQSRRNPNLYWPEHNKDVPSKHIIN